MISAKYIQGGSVTLACDLKEPGRPPASSFIWSETVCHYSNDVGQKQFVNIATMFVNMVLHTGIVS